jgi:hypothetical protein
MDFSNEIPIVEGSSITRKEFENRFLRPGKPAILRGLWKQYPAYSHWNLNYFRQVLGDLKVDLFSSSMAKPGETMNAPHARMKFGDYLELIRNTPTDLRIFLFPVFRYKPELLDDFGYPDITGRYIRIPFLFFGPRNSVTRMHQDIDLSNVFLTQFEGRRKVILFSPDQSAFLYKLPFNVHSTVDITKPDYSAYPALRYARGYSAVLEYGDTLFMPSGYWHHIEYLEGGFGLSVRTLSHDLRTVIRGGYNVTLQRWFDQLMNSVQPEAWLRYKQKCAVRKAEKAMRLFQLPEKSA